jgi:hypothetical protein
MNDAMPCQIMEVLLSDLHFIWHTADDLVWIMQTLSKGLGGDICFEIPCSDMGGTAGFTDLFDYLNNFCQIVEILAKSTTLCVLELPLESYTCSNTPHMALVFFCKKVCIRANVQENHYWVGHWGIVNNLHTTMLIQCLVQSCSGYSPGQGILQYN